MQGKFKHSMRPEIRFVDIDAFGHVNNAHYLTYFEQARVKYFDDVVGWKCLGMTLHDRKYCLAPKRTVGGTQLPCPIQAFGPALGKGRTPDGSAEVTSGPDTPPYLSAVI